MGGWPGAGHIAAVDAWLSSLVRDGEILEVPYHPLTRDNMEKLKEDV